MTNLNLKLLDFHIKDFCVTVIIMSQKLEKITVVEKLSCFVVQTKG